MTTNFDSFATDMRKQVRKLTKEQAPIFVRKIAFEVLKGVVEKTPVDTGRARGNWQASINAPKEQVLKSTDKEGSSTIAKGFTRLGQFTIGQIAYVANNVDYMIFLENGSSKQAPGPGAILRATIFEVEQANK